MIEFVIPGEPKTKGRPRFTKTGHAYTPKETREAEKHIVDCWVADGSEVLSGHIGLSCTFFVGTKRIKDLDNMLKLVQDALNKRAFDDDSQIVELVASKVFESDFPRTVVCLFEVD